MLHGSENNGGNMSLVYCWQTSAGFILGFAKEVAVCFPHGQGIVRCHTCECRHTSSTACMLQ